MGHRNLVCAAVLVTLVGNLTHSQWQFQPPRPEGDPCGTLKDQPWTCQRQSQCTQLATLFSSGRKIICSRSEEEEDIVCCPEPGEGQSQPLSVKTSSISEKKCEQYQQEVCNGDKNRFPPYSINDEYRSTVELVNTSKRAKRQDDESGIDESLIDPIFGGFPAAPAQFPHAALVGYGERSHITWRCGGTLISERFVLTAAHCQGNTISGPPRWVRLGATDYAIGTEDIPPQDFEVVERIVHEGYQEPAFYDDVMLLRLDRDAQFSPYVAPACLHTNLADREGRVIVAGWGKTEQHKRQSSALMLAALDIIPNKRCQDDANNYVTNTKNHLPSGIDAKKMVCAFHPEKDACQGDSGGPLILEDKGNSCLARLVGITSFGPTFCQAPQVPGIYVRVAHYRPWIEARVWPGNSTV